MNVTLVAVAAAVLVAGAGCILFLRTRGERSRGRELAEWARGRGWRYAGVNRDLPRGFDGEPFVRMGTARHVVTGEYRGRRLTAFAYHRRGETGLSPTTRVFVVVMLDTPVHCPQLEVSREHFGHRLLSIVGVHDLRLGDDGWDATFRVRTDDDAFTRRVLCAPVRGWMLGDPRAPQRPVRLAGRQALTWYEGRLTAQTALREADYLADLLDRVPADAWR